MSLSLIAMASMFPILLFRGVPIFVTLGLSSVIYIVIEGLPISLLAQRMFTGIDIFVLLAIPLFALAGEIMNRAGLTEHLVAFAQALVGRVHGGLAAVNVLTSMFFSGITGSAAADASATGSLLIPMMKKAGYSAEFSAAITAISSIVGPIIPPSIVFIMYATLANTSVADLFLAGIIPGLMMSGAHMVTALIISHKRKYEMGTATNAARIIRTGRLALPALMVPVIIVGGILFGIFTPTEAGATAVFTAVILGAFLYRTIHIKELVNAGYKVGVEIADIMLIIGASNLVAWILTVEGVPVLLSELVLGATDNPLIILLLINFIILCIGTVLDTFPALIILTSVLLPIAQSVGVDPVHFGVIISLNLMIGAVTPPVGILLFIGIRISGANMKGTLRETVPFFLVSIIVLLLVTFIPALSSGVVALIR